MAFCPDTVIIKEKIMREFKIEIPEGHEIDKENSTFECIKFKKIEKELPDTWEGLGKIEGYYIDAGSGINTLHVTKSISSTKNTYPTKELAEAAVALTQLLQLREVYNDGQELTWEGTNSNYVIYSFSGDIEKGWASQNQRVLSFKSAKLRDKFLENFKDLIEIAKPLI